MDALKTPADTLTIEISGICVEDVIVERSNLTLRGTDPLLDGIQPSVDDVLYQALNLFNVHEVTIENLSLSEASVGLAINNSVLVTLNHCRFENNVAVGLIVSGTGVVEVNNTIITSEIDPPTRTGVWITNGGDLNCNNCVVENQRDGFRVWRGSDLTLTNTSVQATRRALDMRTGSRTYSFGGNTLEGADVSMLIKGNNSLELRNDTLSGPVDVGQASILLVNNVTHTVSSGANLIASSSSVVAQGTTSLQGDFNINEFSTLYPISPALIMSTRNLTVGRQMTMSRTITSLRRS